MKISITIIGHNEEEHLIEIFNQLKWADEIIYVDCESNDNSMNIAKQFNCKVFSQKNNFNLNVNKSYAIAQASSNWIFYLDPDERIPDELSKEILSIINSNPNESAFELNRKNHFGGKWLKHGSQYPDKQLRLFKKGFAFFPNNHVHEKLTVNGKIGKLKSDMLHFPYKNISQYLSKFDFYTSFDASILYHKNFKITFVNSLRYLFTIPVARFLRRYFLKLGFLDGLAGLFAALFDACNFVVRYLKLHELIKEGSKNK